LQNILNDPGIHRVWKEARVAKKLERHGYDECSNKEQTREHKDICSVSGSVTATAEQYAIQLLADRPI